MESAGLKERVEKALARFLLDQRTILSGIDPALETVAETIERFVLHGGKRLRPAFAYWGFRGAGGEDSEQIVAAVAALEFVQASALMHDDLMDASDTRRGEPSVHRRFEVVHSASGWDGDPKVFGAGAAILLGDFCLAWSDELLRRSGIDVDVLLRARPVFDLMRTEVIAGQYLDVHAQVTGDTSMQRASTVARYKSAKYTVERPLLLGAAMADAPPEIRAAYSGYGLPLGEAFQLRDDILGVFGNPAQTGKPAGDDLREGKRTYLIACAFAAADVVAADRLRAGLGNPRLDATGIAELREIIIDTGALARTEERIANLTEASLRALRSVTLADDTAGMLESLAQAATSRSG
ncbi:MAG TPA: polyprenyl synthetase family protein [Micromonosporaceae bacterium]|jgi:geranylgeranyl diphosphate synthase type I